MLKTKGIVLKYRRRFDIIADILQVAGRGARKTRIMYFANLSYMLLKKYLDHTLRVGFLKFDGENYEVTDRGLAFLELYRGFSSKSARVKQDVESLSMEEETLNHMCTPGRRRTGKNRICT